MLKNRLHPYEAGWLTFLVERGLATAEDATEARNRIAQDAVRELEERARRKRLMKKRKKRRDE